MRLLNRAFLGMNWRMWRLITAAKPGFQVLSPAPVQRFSANIEQFSWRWMLLLSSEQGSSLPEVSDGCLVVPPPCNLLGQTSPAWSYPKQVPVLLAAANIYLRLVTLNELTLQENYKGQIAAEGFVEAGRGDCLRRQRLRAGFLIVGGQEGRLPQGTVSSEHYMCVNSGASNGCSGNFLWIAKDIPYATVQDKPLHFSLEHVHVVSVSPRMLAAFIVARYCRIWA